MTTEPAAKTLIQVQDGDNDPVTGTKVGHVIRKSTQYLIYLDERDEVRWTLADSVTVPKQGSDGFGLLIIAANDPLTGVPYGLKRQLRVHIGVGMAEVLEHGTPRSTAARLDDVVGDAKSRIQDRWVVEGTLMNVTLAALSALTLAAFWESIVLTTGEIVAVVLAGALAGGLGCLAVTLLRPAGAREPTPGATAWHLRATGLAYATGCGVWAGFVVLFSHGAQVLAGDTKGQILVAFLVGACMRPMLEIAARGGNALTRQLSLLRNTAVEERNE